MSDLYTECIVKRQTGIAQKMAKFGLIFATVAALFVGLFLPVGIIGLIPVILCFAADYFLMPGLELEFEYLYVNGELDVDKIMSKQKRKRAYTMDVSNLEIMAPSNSHELDYYNNNKNIKTYDFSSRMADHNTYTMIVNGPSQLEKVIFEPNEIIVSDMKRVAPRKVFNY